MGIYKDKLKEEALNEAKTPKRTFYSGYLLSRVGRDEYVWSHIYTSAAKSEVIFEINNTVKGSEEMYAGQHIQKITAKG